MHATICEFPSETLYASRLTCHESVAGHLLRDLPEVNDDSEFSDVVSLPVVFFDTAGCEFFERLETNEEGGGGDEGSRRNENEATLVKQWVDKLVRLPWRLFVRRLKGCTGRSRSSTQSDRPHNTVSNTSLLFSPLIRKGLIY